MTRGSLRLTETKGEKEEGEDEGEHEEEKGKKICHVNERNWSTSTEVWHW